MVVIHNANFQMPNKLRLLGRVPLPAIQQMPGPYSRKSGSLAKPPQISIDCLNFGLPWFSRLTLVANCTPVAIFN